MLSISLPQQPRNIARFRAAAIGATAIAILATSLATSAAPASAATLNPDHEINGGDYTIKFDPNSRSGHVDASGTPTDSALVWGPESVEISTGCPEGYRAASRTFLVTEDGLETQSAAQRTNANAALYGLQGNPITLTSIRASAWTNLNAAQLPTGTNRFVVTCDATLGASGDPIGDSKYFVAYIKVDRTAESWEIVDRPVETVATTTTVTTSAVTGSSATVTATISPADAGGTVVFTQNGTEVTAPQPVNAGTASASISGLTPETAYTFGAKYSGDAKHNASEGAAAEVTTQSVNDSSTSSVAVTVPTSTVTVPTGLSISVKPQNVTLTGPAARAAGTVWDASGKLGNVTVNDDRQQAGTAWTLSGGVGTFTDGSKQIAAANLGWTPNLISGTGTAGATVQPGTAGGLGTEQPLATGTGGTDANRATTVDADLKLSVPADAQDGSYSATLTLTLI